jgi:PAS domain S-box-containing protein
VLVINVLCSRPGRDIPLSIFEKCVDFLPDAILAIDIDGKVIIWNPAMEKMTGALAIDMIGKGNYEYALPFYGIRRPILADLVLMPQDEVDGKYDTVQRVGKTLTVEIFIPTFGTNGFPGRDCWRH